MKINACAQEGHGHFSPTGPDVIQERPILGIACEITKKIAQSSRSCNISATIHIKKQEQQTPKKEQQRTQTTQKSNKQQKTHRTQVALHVLNRALALQKST